MFPIVEVLVCITIINNKNLYKFNIKIIYKGTSRHKETNSWGMEAKGAMKSREKEEG